MGGKTTKFADRPKSHINCKSSNKDAPTAYMASESVYRAYVPEDKVSWSVDYPEYEPVEFTSQTVLKNKEWADPANPWNIFNWNKLTTIDRTSIMGKYEVIHGVPQNPVGRTGIKGRGRLGKWGPNHAADPIVSRWKLDDKGKKVKDPNSKKPILQFVAIQRADTNEWAIPGGMCDVGETVSKTLKREFLEEAADTTDPEVAKKNKEVAKKFDNFFKKGKEVYKGYVDDPRNTDNSWMETVVHSFHDAKNSIFKNFDLKAGDDATNVKWMDINSDMELYASHKSFIEKAANKYKAHWSKPEPKPKKEKKVKAKKEKKTKKDKKQKESKKEEVVEESKVDVEQTKEVEEVKEVKAEEEVKTE